MASEASKAGMAEDMESASHTSSALANGTGPVLATSVEAPLSALRLTPVLLRFHPVDAVTSVFFDEANKQMFVVREGSADVTVSSLATSSEETIRFVGHLAGVCVCVWGGGG